MKQRQHNRRWRVMPRGQSHRNRVATKPHARRESQRERTYRCYRKGRQSEWVADDVPHVDAPAAGAVLQPRVFHFPERWGVQRTVRGHRGKFAVETRLCAKTPGRIKQVAMLRCLMQFIRRDSGVQQQGHGS